MLLVVVIHLQAMRSGFAAQALQTRHEQDARVPTIVQSRSDTKMTRDRWLNAFDIATLVHCAATTFVTIVLTMMHAPCIKNAPQISRLAARMTLRPQSPLSGLCGRPHQHLMRCPSRVSSLSWISSYDTHGN